MTSAAGPLCAWALRGALRQPRGYHARFMVVAYAILLTTLATRAAGGVGAAGKLMVGGMFWLNYGVVLLVGATAFGPMLAREREAGTASLLRLTGRRLGTLLLAKAMGPLWSCTALLLVQVPFAMLGVTLGGVSSSQALTASALILAHAARTFGVALACSSLARTAPTGGRLATLALIALEFLLPVLGRLGPSFGTDLTSTASAALLLWTDVDAVWRRIAVLVAIGMASVGIAMLAFGHAPTEPMALRRAARRINRPEPGAAAFTWSEFHFVLGGRRSLAVYALLSAAVALLSRGTWYAFVLVVLALEGSRSLRRDVESEVLPLLLMTPPPIPQWLAARRRCQWLLLAVLLAAGAPGLWWIHGRADLLDELVAVALLGPVVIQAQRSGLTRTDMPLLVAVLRSFAAWILIQFLASLLIFLSLMADGKEGRGRLHAFGVAASAVLYAYSQRNVSVAAARRRVCQP